MQLVVCTPLEGGITGLTSGEALNFYHSITRTAFRITDNSFRLPLMRELFSFAKTKGEIFGQLLQHKAWRNALTSAFGIHLPLYTRTANPTKERIGDPYDGGLYGLALSSPLLIAVPRFFSP